MVSRDLMDELYPISAQVCDHCGGSGMVCDRYQPKFITCFVCSGSGWSMPPGAFRRALELMMMEEQNE